jgi:hypothetical protein
MDSLESPYQYDDTLRRISVGYLVTALRAFRAAISNAGKAPST